MACGITDPLGCVGQLAGSAASSAWDAICLSFAAAADTLLKSFARAFTAIPPVDLTSPGVKNVYAICLGIAAAIAVLLLLGQVIRTAFTHDGTALAEGLAGIGKAAAAFLLTLTIASAAVTAADSLTSYIISHSFGSAAQLTARITTLLSFTGTAANPGGQLAGGASLLLLLAIIGIVLILVLWFELLLRNAAIAVLVATSPIAAAGMASAPSRAWWPRMAAATGQLIILKPVIALVFALGLELTGTSHDVETLLTGMLILLLAAIAWPVIARFFTFTSVGLTGSTGLGMVLGFAAGRLTSVGPAAGGLPGQPASTAGAAGSGEAAAAGAAGGAATAGVLALAAAGVQAAHKAATALSGRMDQVAGHAGLAPPGYQNGQGWAPAGQARSSQPTATRQPAPPAPAHPGQDTWASAAAPPQWPAEWAAGQPGSATPQDWPEPDPDPWSRGDWTRETSPAAEEPPPAAPGQEQPAPPPSPRPPAPRPEQEPPAGDGSPPGVPE
jgi:hypothetical protein